MVFQGCQQMGATPNLKKVIRNNPRVNERQLRDALEAIRDLRACGCKPAEFNLVLPFTRSFPKVSQDTGREPQHSRRS
jgi:hypothetical protein